MVALPGLTYAERVTVLSSNGLRAVLQEVVPPFERATGHEVAITFSVAAELKKRIDAGEPFDVVVLTPALIDDLVRVQKVSAESRTVIARSGMAIAVRRGARKPDIHSPDALTTALLNASSIAFAREGAGGVFFNALIQRLGLAERLAPRLKPVTTGTDVSQAVARGDAEFGILPVSEILSAPGVDLLGPFPAALQDYAVMVGAVRVPATRGGEALLQFLKSSGIDLAIARHGMERIGP